MTCARPFIVMAATILPLGMTGCQASPSATPAQAGICRADAAAGLAGKDRISDDEAMRLTGATIVRQIKPGDGVTMDFRQERVTIETDPATGRIIRASCG